MLKLIVGQQEAFDENLDAFVLTGGHEILLEHSLVSVSKWESKWEKPFLDSHEKTIEETQYYLECMCLDDVYHQHLAKLTQADMAQINGYLESKGTATWFSDNTSAPPSREVITSEVIYYWMTALNIPMECETWNLKRLMTLIRVANEKNQPEKKTSRAETMQRHRALNAQRRQQRKG